MVHEVEVSQFTSNRHLLVHRFLELNIPMHPSFMNLILRPIAGSSAINHELVSLLENLEGHTFAFPVPLDDYEELRVLIGRRNLRSGQGGVGVYHIYETVPPYRNLVGQSISLRERLNSYVKDVTAALEAGTPDKLTLKGKGAQ